MRNTMLLLLGLALAACGGSAESTTTTETSANEATAGDEARPLVPIGQTQIGDRSSCPVSGEEFTVTESSPTVEHDGHTYHFCCPGCAQRFEANPHQFLQNHAHEGEADAS